jgi:Ran GTPase-activating protein (RanGAP) involved in mRNA processing and transport
MDDECSEAIAEGLSRNTTLRHLDISTNRIGGQSLKRWQEVIGKANLRYFDISNNPLYDEGAQCLIRGLMEGTLVTEEMAKLHPHLGPAWSRLTPKLKYVHLKNVNMGDETGVLVTQLISTNKRLLKLSIDNNTINFKYIDEINAACARN